MTAIADETGSGHPLSGSQRILVVEDQGLLADDLATALRSAGHHVVGPEPTVDRALKRLSSEAALDAAILDINLRGKLVWPVADELAGRGIPFMFVTGYDDEAVPARFEHVARSRKPVDADRIVEALIAGMAEQAR